MINDGPGPRQILDRDAVVAAVDLRTLADRLLGRRADTAGSPTWPCPDPEHPHMAREPGEVKTYLTRRGEQRWHCHGCGSGGTAVDLVMKARRTGVREALLYLAEPAPALRSSPSPASPMARADPALGRGDFDAWVAHATDLLSQPYGEPVRKWLTEVRGIPDDVLRVNRIGATAITPGHMLPTRRGIPGRRAASPSAVLPVLAKGRPIHAQLRLIDPQPGEPAYLNPPASGKTRHPRLGLYRPAQRQHAEILVTNGIIDALSANAAGYRSAAVLSPGLADAEVAVHLSRLNGPLVLALGPTGPGDVAADRLMLHLEARGRRPTILTTFNGDLNDALVTAGDWPRKLAAHVGQAVAIGPSDPLPTL